MWEFFTALTFEFVIIVLALAIGYAMGSSKDPAVTDIVTEAEILVVLRTLSTPLEPEVALEAVRRIRDQGALFREVTEA